MAQLRFLLNKLRHRETILPIEILDRPLLLAIESRRELRRARSLANERELIARIVEHLSPSDTIYDVGANIGIVSLALAIHAPGPHGRIHSFEPEPTNFRQLSRNIGLNGLLDRIVPHRMALGATEGEVELFVRPGAGEGRHSIASAKGSKGSIQVQVSTVTSLARSTSEPPDVMKIDVEGAEGQVLAGMESLLRERSVRELFLEIHAKGNGDRMPDGALIDDWLAERGYAKVWERRQGAQVQRHYR